jgi:cytochrome b561
LPKNQQYHYYYYIIIFHAVTASCLFLAIILGYCAIYLATDHKALLLMLHRSFGLIGMLSSFSMLAARIYRKPRPILGFSRFENFSRIMVKLALYILPVLVFITGYFTLAFKVQYINFFEFLWVPTFIKPNHVYKTLFSTFHYWLNVFFVLTITIHVRAVLHHFITHRRLLYRMFPFKIFRRNK